MPTILGSMTPPVNWLDIWAHAASLVTSPDLARSGVHARPSEGIDPWVIHADNSSGKTQPPGDTAANPFGLVNMLGNVREFCLDWYAPDSYADYPAGSLIHNPRGPLSGDERVVRGGSFRSDPAVMRSAARDRTRTESWLMTDPQIPKSLWWYSDCIDVGFRVVCELDDGGN